MEVQGDSYEVIYHPETVIISFQGSLRLSGVEEYAPIVEILNKVASENHEIITLDLRKLEFLNSSGISMLSKFVINIRKQKNSKIVVKGSQSIPWQGKSLKNLQRLMPNLALELE